DGSLKVGEGVILPLPNARVGEMCISKREFDGVFSEGMLLSAVELGLEAYSDVVLKCLEDLSPGIFAYNLLGFGEYLLEIEVTPNRGDMLSVRGLARDICAIFGREFKDEERVGFEDTNNINIEILDEDCKRYRGALIEGITVKDSPLWIKRR